MTGRTIKRACVAALVALVALPIGASTASASVGEIAAELPAAAPFESVRLGSRGERVLQVQYVLRSLGYSLSVDGQFGRRTETAVKSFQTSRQLRADGIVGPNTWAALTASSSSPVAAAPGPPPVTAEPATPRYRHPNPLVERWHAAAVEAGWQEAEWQRLSCIIHRESGGNAAAKHRSSSASGLLQIMWTSHSRWIGGSVSQLFDGPTNLRLGRQLFLRSGGWSPWRSTTAGC